MISGSRPLREPRPWLAPLAPLYWTASRLHGTWMRRTGPRRPLPGIPLVVVGALRAGGSGKTAVTAALARRYADRGFRVAVLAYRLGPGPRSGGLDLVEVGEDGDWRLTSDEAVMLRRLTGARVFATRARARAWRALDSEGSRLGGPFDLVLSDDGYQDPRLAGAFRILLTAPGEKPGLRDLLPAGPYRETWGARLRADLILEGPHPDGEAAAPADGPRFSRRLVLPPGLDRERPWIALCALGNNARFLADLGRQGIAPAHVLEARDHAAVPEGRIAAAASRFPGAGILCTEKDFLKLDPGAASRLGVLAVGERIEPGPAAWDAVEGYLRGFQARTRARSGRTAARRPGEP